MLPKGWEFEKIGNYINTMMGFAFKSTNFVANGVPLIRMGNLYQNSLDLTRNSVFLPKEFLNEYSRFLVQENDLVMSMTGTMGKRDYGFVVLVDKVACGSFLNQRVMKVSANSKSNNNFLLNLMRSEYFLNLLYSYPAGTKQAN